MIEIRKFASPAEIAAEAAGLVAATLKETLESHQLATFVLAGGRLPPVAYSVLAERFADAFDWRRVLFLIGDERCVPLDSPDSCWLGALPMFDAHPEIPANNKLRPQSQLSAESAAEAYAKTLLTLPLNQSGMPIFNHLWFGMGEDGHTLSLFPDHQSMTLAKDADKLVIPVHDSPKPPPDRISFTLKALEGVESAVALISGTGKAPIIAQIANGDHSLPIVMASRTIDKAGGRVTWLVDDEALSRLKPGQKLVI
ncbi:MAG: 6-phosphogluconolactonase [Acidobacteriota bacterium]